jgi:FkbM family methyltransferase
MNAGVDGEGQERLSSRDFVTLKTVIQHSLLLAYRWIHGSGVLSRPWGRRVFEGAYFRYKSVLEAGDIQPMRALVKPGDWIIDVGANIGFFTRAFGQWVSSGGRVIAIEPEAANYRSLVDRLDRLGLATAVDAVQAVAAETDGTLRLSVNRYHPADHRIAPEGIEVRAITLDRLLAERGWPRVALVKVDVQGAEWRVLEGARETLRRFRPALFMELDDEALRLMNTSAGQLLDWLLGLGYRPHRIVSGRITDRLPREEVLAQSLSGRYADLLFLPATDSQRTGRV